MVRPSTRERASTRSLLESVGKGRALHPASAEAMRRLLDRDVGIEGLSRLFQPNFPGVRAFAIEARAAPDGAVEMTLIGVARDGRPVWTGTRAFARGRDGSLEIHRGFDEIEPDYQSRNITVDLMQREVEVLGLLDGGPSARLTIDADQVGRYVCALHGFVFADETEEGPPVRSVRALDPSSDRANLIAAVPLVVERVAMRRGFGKIAIESAMEQISRCRSPWDFARVSTHEPPRELAESDDGQLGVGDIGRELLLAKETPPWRAALYVKPSDPDAQARGQEYRRRKTVRSETRLRAELEEATRDLESSQKPSRIRALRTFGRLAPSSFGPELKRLADGKDRRIAAVARQTLRQMSGADLPARLLEFAAELKNEPRLRGLAYRVLAEHYPSRLVDRVSMLRVDPDARIQRAVIPLSVEDSGTAGPMLAALLAANEWPSEGSGRPGLLELRLELIEMLGWLADPSTLPALMAAFRAQPPPPAAERLALSRALVAFPDPRAQTVLRESTRLFERPPIP